jgi:AbrB family looped-hinge helix DNA binding protein
VREDEMSKVKAEKPGVVRPDLGQRYTSLVTSRGRTTLPREVRDLLGVAGGGSVRFLRDEDGDYRIAKLYARDDEERSS